jgi:hypothetical protein
VGFQRREHDANELFVHVERGGGDRPALRITVVESSGRIVIAELSFAPDERLDVASFYPDQRR